MAEANTTVKLPPRLAEQAQLYINSGWFQDLDALVVEALRRYLEAHQMELMEQFIQEDVEWGLHGHD